MGRVEGPLREPDDKSNRFFPNRYFVGKLYILAQNPEPR